MSSNAQRMDKVRNKVLKCLINGTMSHYLRFPMKLRTYQREREVAAAGVSGVAGMHGAIIAEVEQVWLQRGQASADFLLEVVWGHAGRVLRNGLTVTLA